MSENKIDWSSHPVRNTTIAFRTTNEDVARLKALCRRTGARSLSDFMQRFINLYLPQLEEETQNGKDVI